MDTNVMPAGVAHGNEAVQTHTPKITAAQSLNELLGDFAFYTTGAILSHYAQIPEDPLLVLGRTLNRSIAHFVMRFDRPIFAGLPVEILNHALLGIEREAWDLYANQLKGITLLDRPNRIMSQFRLKELTILDPLERQRKGVITGLTVPVTAVCVESNRGCWYFDNEAGLNLPPTFRYTADVFPDFVAQAERLLGPAITS